MPRGITPRRPTRTGRQDKVDLAQQKSAGSKSARVGTGALARLGRGKASAAAPAGRKKAAVKPAPAMAAKIKGYNPLAPDRVAEILKRLDQLYPAVTCALTHSSAWELLVATILSAQSTDN